MELAAIIAGLLAITAGLVVVAASGLPWIAAHQRYIAAAGWREAGRLGLRRLLGGVCGLAARVRYRLRPGWVFAATAGMGLVVICLAAAGSGEVVEELTAGDGMALLDRPVTAFVVAHRSGGLTAVMRVVSTAGGPLIVTIVAAATGLLAGVVRRSWGPVLVAGVTLAGTGILTVVLKAVLGRPRPPLHDALAAADGYAFPSGHAATAAAAFGVLAYLIAAGLRWWAARVAVWAAAAMLTVLVGISRVYLGVHWTTDVLGGWAFGVLWLAVVLSAWAVLAGYHSGAFAQGSRSPWRPSTARGGAGSLAAMSPADGSVSLWR
jgi:membrane-associated phospholipid phosphatase